MSYRRSSLGNSVVRGFGLAAGFALFSLVAGVVSAMTVGVWAATEKLHPVARWLVRGLVVAVVVVGLLVLLAEL